MSAAAEYIRLVGSAIILAALMDMLAPEGSFKKYCRLVSGFAVLAVMLSPIAANYSVPAEMTASADYELAEAEARARILLRHRENLEEILERNIPGCEAHVEVDGEGNVTRVTIENAPDEDAARSYVRETFGAEGSEVRINENKGAA